MTKKIIFSMTAFEMIDWVDKHWLFMAFLYALERNNWRKDDRE